MYAFYYISWEMLIYLDRSVRTVECSVGQQTLRHTPKGAPVVTVRRTAQEDASGANGETIEKAAKPLCKNT